LIVLLVACRSTPKTVETSGLQEIGISATPANVYGASETMLVRMAHIDHTSIVLHQFIHDDYLLKPANLVVMDALQGIQNGPVPTYGVSGTTDIARTR